jgi:hypothetical protein
VRLESTRLGLGSVATLMRNLAPVLPILASGAFVLACNTPPKDPPRDGADVPIGLVSGPGTTMPPTAPPPTAPASTSTGTGAGPTGSARPAQPGRPAACASDADCRTFSSYCSEAPCACRVLAKSDGDPKCLGSGPNVSCFVDPCLNKAARCQNGACALTAKGAATQ